MLPYFARFCRIPRGLVFFLMYYSQMSCVLYYARRHKAKSKCLDVFETVLVICHNLLRYKTRTAKFFRLLVLVAINSGGKVPSRNRCFLSCGNYDTIRSFANLSKSCFCPNSLKNIVAFMSGLFPSRLITFPKPKRSCSTSIPT